MHLAPFALSALALSSIATAQPVTPTAQGQIDLDRVMAQMNSRAGATLSLAVTERIEADPDLAIVTGGVTTTAPTATEALRQNSAEMQKVIAAVRRAGIAETDVQTVGVTLSAQYDYRNREDGQPPRFIGYQASNRVQLRIKDIPKIGPILDALVQAGATDINGPDFQLENSDELEAQARLRTIATAQARADAYARAAGFARARLTGISETGSFPEPRPMPMAARADMMQVSATPISPGQVRQAVTVNFTYLLER